MFNLNIKIRFDSKNDLMSYYKSILPELEEKYDRSKITISKRDCDLNVEIKASDKTALRASLNGIYKPLVLYNELKGGN